MTDQGDWIILRTQGRSTLTLAETLCKDGFDVWTPAHKQIVRIPRMNVKREITLPILPSFIFARSDHLHELLQLEKMPMKARRVVPEFRRDMPNEARYHRNFHVFRYLDSIPMIADRHLDPLRVKEREAVPKKARARFDRGAGVSVNNGPFQGLKGRVERCRSGYALVIFDDWKRPVQIPTFLLAEDTSFLEPRCSDGGA